MKTVTKTITFSRKTSSEWTPDAEYNKRLINSRIIMLRRMFHMWGFVSLNQIKECFLIKDSLKQVNYLKECMFLHSRDDYEKFEPVVSQDKNDPTKFKITMQFVDYSKGDK
jgi:hypothetical protein